MIPLSLFRVVGHSMEPTIKNGAIVVVSSIPYLFTSPKEGDIILFTTVGKMFVKRIKKAESGKYFLEGDNKSDSLDSRKMGWIDRNDIIGKIIFKIP